MRHGFQGCRPSYLAELNVRFGWCSDLLLSQSVAIRCADVWPSLPVDGAFAFTRFANILRHIFLRVRFVTV